MRSGLDAHFGRNKSLIFYHTHPLTAQTSFFPGTHDVAFMAGMPRHAFIDMVGSELGLTALMQTAKTTKLPFSEYLKMETIEKKLQHSQEYADAKVKGVSTGDFSDYSKIMSDLGFGFYYWKPESLQPGDLNSGVTLQRTAV